MAEIARLHHLAWIRRAAATALALFTAVACAPPTPAPAPHPEGPAPVAAIDPLDAPWIVRASPGSFAQRMTVASELVSRIDTVQRVDSTNAFVSLEWTRLAGAAPARLSGLLTEFAISADTSPPATPASVRLPITFAAQEGRDAAQMLPLNPDPAGCDSHAAAVAMARELFVAPPTRVERGTVWSDSASYTICRDSIPLTVRSHREFRVTGAERREGAIVVLVERRSRLTMQGEGLQFGETVAITADGESEASLAIRAEGAVVISGTATATLRMQMRGRRRSQELTQHTRIEIAGR